MENIFDQDRFAEIAGSGELITVIYKGGLAPGTKRKILVRTLNSHSMEVVEYPSHAPKTYLVDKTMIVQDDHPALWMPEDAGRSKVVDPKEYFADWCYEIREPLYPALGVTVRSFIDKEKSSAAREAAIANGMPKTEATKRIKIMYMAHAVSIPPNFDFHEGDVFYRRGDQASYVQVLGVKSSEQEPLIEVHVPALGAKRLAFHVPSHVLAEVLRNGQNFPFASGINASQSLKESLRYCILDPGQP